VALKNIASKTSNLSLSSKDRLPLYCTYTTTKFFNRAKQNFQVGCMWATDVT